MALAGHPRLCETRLYEAALPRPLSQLTSGPYFLQHLVCVVGVQKMERETRAKKVP